ncbi:FAD/NAD(P)-binding domain-containing protein [Dichomitus squalens LYAD-421 SS1]|uniref:FAD/NAD(P)-binding domain-containing protein n=1 Tax=Dichomitus squalens (strain LYAD-421) TaxID=732165 RepID=UPI0004414A61|nr:FAD/NAD(P)-binding domain-containing protein [Dichomitus squalens LYAD-421 SS1]EJF67219.1 FAD/NAD(P)-binding domain-containing protein [Dichomitus squalens LYAD-421 SS1]
MSAESTKSGPPLQTSHALDFLIIGGGIAGLAAATALRRVGHNALVLEKGERGSVRGSGGVRLPPNLTKILFHWGLKPALMQKALVSHTMTFMRYESGDYLGEHVWDTGILKETRGDYMLCTHDDLHDILYDRATELGAQVRYGANVVDIDVENREVTLENGEKLVGDVLVGADGEYGVSRATVVGQSVNGHPTGVVMYDTVISSDDLKEHVQSLWKDNAIFTAFGHRHALLAYPIHDTDEIALQFYGPDNATGNYGDEPSVDVPEIAEELDVRLRLHMKKARKAIRVSVRAHDDIEDWVSDDGPLVVIGEAAHPFPPGTIQATAMAVEDGAVLAKLFSHLSENRQIQDFLYAFQELRQARTRAARAGEFGNVFYMTLEDGEESRTRDSGMRAKAAEGAHNVLEGLAGDVSRLWDQIRTTFGYDCEDEADDWWVQWGVLRERAIERDTEDQAASALLDFSGLTMQVTETATDESE